MRIFFFFLIMILLNPPSLWIEGTSCITQCVMALLLCTNDHIFCFINFMMMVINNVMYLIIYFYVNIMLVLRQLWCYLVKFVVLS